MRTVATSRWIDRYRRDGYHAPLRVLSPEEAGACRARLEAFEAERGGPLQGDLRHRAHVFLVWLDELVRNPRILDAVEVILGRNLLVWSSSFFIKEGGDGKHVPWHQDARAYGALAPDVVTAWVALTDSTAENGALQVIPGSHRQGELEHVTRHVPDSLLTRRPEVALGVDESAAVTIPLKAGEMSLHHPGLVHGSAPNRVSDRRIGVAVRYVRPPARRATGRRERAMLVRGVDAGHFFDALPRPERDGAPEALARHRELMHPSGSRPVVRVGSAAWTRPVALRGRLLARDGQGILVCGPAGGGEPGLAAALARRGWSELDAAGSVPEARHGAAGEHATDRHRASGRIALAAILLPARSSASIKAPPAVMPPAHGLLALVPYRDAADPTDLARGIEDLRPLVEAVPVYQGASDGDRVLEAVERHPADAADAPEGGGPSNPSPAVWVEVQNPPMGGPWPAPNEEPRHE